MGANFPSLLPKPSEASKKLMSGANSELLLILLLLFSKSRKYSPKNCPDKSSESEIQYSLSEAKTKGNFSFPGLLIVFNAFNAFKHAESLSI